MQKIIFSLLIFLTTTQILAIENKKITIELLWKHQFEFAGYYMAIEKGYYKDVGLDVELIEYQYGSDISQNINTGKYNFGIGRSTLLLDQAHGKDLYLIYPLLQHSPLVIMTKKRPDIQSVKDLAGKTIMATQSHSSEASFNAMFKLNQITNKDFVEIPHSFNIQDLIDGKVDAMSVYITNEPYFLLQKNIEYTIFDPSHYGFNFYEDILFTSKQFQNTNPKIVEAFKNATKKGWEDAYSDIETTAKLIYKKYNTQNKTLAHLIYEGNELKKMSRYGHKEFLKFKPEVLTQIVQTYNLLDLIKSTIDFNRFIDPTSIYQDFEIDFGFVLKIVAVVSIILLFIMIWIRKISNFNKAIQLSNEMLEKKSHELEETNEILQHTQIQLQKTINALEKEKSKAEQAVLYKSQFLANMSHEIRTPMNAVIGMAYLLSKTELDEKQKNYLHKIDISSKSLLNIINDILDFSKVEAGKLKLERIDFSLLEVIANVEDIISLKAFEKGIELKTTISTTVEQVYFGDPLRLTQILVNLMGNAIKFTLHGKVELMVKNLDHDRVLFEIKDTGIGISKDQINKLFESFIQADNSTTREFGGTGLGLSISKQLAHLMDGEITLQSELNVGSSFFVEIYLPKGDKNNLKALRNKNTDIDQKLDFMNQSILVVEDNLINQELVIGLLENHNIQIDVAHNGVEAIDIFMKNLEKYKLILMDIQMPIMNGFEATKEIRMIDKNIPIIALTANALQSDIEATKIALMNEHISKPINVIELEDILKKYIPYKAHERNLNQDTSDKLSLSDLRYINVKDALGMLNGNKKLYLQVIEGFYKKYHDMKLESLEKDDLKKVLHSIKGVCGNIGAAQLYGMIVEYEKEQSDQRFEAIHKMFQNVLDELQSILSKKK